MAADATVAANDGKGHTIVLRKGGNGWTCLMTGTDPVRLPVCYDANGMAWRKAIVTGHAPDPAMCRRAPSCSTATCWRTKIAG